MPPAARFTDSVSHPLPPLLSPDPGSTTILIGFLPAWRGMPLAAAAPIAFVAEQTLKTSLLASLSAAISSAAAGTDIHNCLTPVPVPPHCPGGVIDGSATVLIDFLPAARMGDTVLEALGGPNKITKGEKTVLLGG